MGHPATSSPTTRSRHYLVRIGAAGVLSLAVVATWTLMMNLAVNNLALEQTQESMTASAAARPLGVAWALLEVTAVVALAVVVRWTWLMWLAAPGLVVAATLVFYQQGHGAALVLGLAASVLAVVGGAGAVVIRAHAKARQLRGYVRNERT